MTASCRTATLIARRFIWGHRCYSNGQRAPTLKVSRFAEWDARIEKALPQKLKPFWNHEAGLKTIFFWAPSWKWVLVSAGLADYTRPADKLSVRQALALAVTGFVWARWSLVIIPKNWNLFSVNLFLGLTGCLQLLRIILYHRSLAHANPHGCPPKHSGDGVPPHGLIKSGVFPKQVTQYLPPVAPPGTKMIFAPGVTPPQGILGPSGMQETTAVTHESKLTQDN